MTVGIVGCGIQGSGCASVLSRDDTVDRIIVLDLSQEKLDGMLKETNCDKITAYVSDANDIEGMIEKLQGCKVVFDFLLPEFTVNVMKVALALEATYINTAYDQPFWGEIVNGQPLTLDKEFKEKGLTALFGCGNTPGMVNVVIRKYTDKLNTVDSISMFGAYTDVHNKMLQPWDPGWSLKQAYLDFVTPPYIFRDGKYVQMPPFSEVETRPFLDYGDRTFALHSHEENYSLPMTIQKGIKKVEFKYELDPHAAVFYATGFTPDRELDVKGQKINALDLVVESILENNKTLVRDNINDDDYSTVIIIEGSDRLGQRRMVVVVPPLFTDAEHVMDKFGTIQVDVCVPAIVGWKCLPDNLKGIVFAEELDPDQYLSMLYDYIDFKEYLMRDTRKYNKE